MAQSTRVLAHSTLMQLFDIESRLQSIEGSGLMVVVYAMAKHHFDCVSKVRVNVSCPPLNVSLALPL